jgi:predicted anti-sigma-YlaC factor YlaD
MMNLDRPVELPCQEVVELVTDYLEEALLPATKEMVDNHLARCPDCTGYFEQVRHTIAVLRTLAQEPVLPESREKLLQKFRQWSEQ